MKQMSLSKSSFERKTKRELLDEMNLVVPRAKLVSLIQPHAPASGAKSGRPPFAVLIRLRIHFIQQWFNLSDPAMEEALYDTPMLRDVVGLDAGEDNRPDESTILRFRHLLEAHDLSIQILATVNATLAAKSLLLKSETVVDATLEKAKASTRAKLEYPFREIKRQFGHVKVRYQGLAKNTSQLHTLFALINLWMVRRALLQGLRT